MNRAEVIMTINKVGEYFGGVVEALCGGKYAAGYKRAVYDMAELFKKAPIDPDFEAEREAMLAHIRALEKKNAELEQDMHTKDATIQKLLFHIDIAEVLGVETKKPKEPKTRRRGVAFVFHK